MAINTATIQHRRGSLEDFNPEKLMPGEIAVITDERSVHMGFPGGGTERIILEKDFTSESIKEKLGYEPADEERVDQLFRDKADYQYVDKKVSNVKVDLTGYAKEDYVDDEIEELNKKIVQETGKLSNEISDLKAGYSPEMVIPLNVIMEKGGLYGNGGDVDSDYAFRSAWMKFDKITCLFVDQNKYNDFKIYVYKKDTSGSVKIFGNDSDRKYSRYIITDLDCEYRFGITKLDTLSIFSYEEMKSVLHVYENQKNVYSESIVKSYNLVLMFGKGTINNNDTLSLGPTDELSTLNLIQTDHDGFIEFTNPKDYAVIVYETNVDFAKISRTVYYGYDISFEVKSTSLYWLMLYKENDAYEPIVISAVFKTEVNASNGKVNMIWEQGGMDGSGSFVTSSKRLVSNRIQTRKNELFLIMFPQELQCVVNTYSDTTNDRLNTGFYNAPFSIQGQEHFIRISLRYTDDSDITIENAKSLLEKVVVYKVVKTNPLYDIVIGSSECEDECDIKCDGLNDQEILQSAICCNISINILLRDGKYNLDKVYTTHKSGQKSALFTNDLFINYKCVKISGLRSTRQLDMSSTRIYCNFVVNDNDENSCILVPRQNVALDYIGLTSTLLDIENVSISGCGYTKPIVYVDATHANSARLSNIIIYAQGIEVEMPIFPTRPCVDCVGIRAGYGSNNGIQNYIKNCLVYGCGKGYSVCGEHYIIEDCLAHHCYVGFAFGDRLTRGNYEHPNVMIGCSIEGSYRLMELSRYGATEESIATHATNTLVCIGLSTESFWEIPLDERTDETTNLVPTLPIKEIVKGAYRGRIEVDYHASPFEEGSGSRMKYTAYTTNGALEG